MGLVLRCFYVGFGLSWRGLERWLFRGGRIREGWMDKIAKTMSAIAKQLKANFTLSGSTITYDEVFSPTGLLPAIVKRADQLASLCLGYGIGATFEDAEGTKLGTKVKFDEVTPNVVRYMTMTDVLTELMQSAPSKDKTPLDELMYD